MCTIFCLVSTRWEKRHHVNNSKDFAREVCKPKVHVKTSWVIFGIIHSNAQYTKCNHPFENLTLYLEVTGFKRQISALLQHLSGKNLIIIKFLANDVSPGVLVMSVKK